MFVFHIALSLTFIALASGCALYVYSGCETKKHCFIKFIAALIILISLISSVCTIYNAMRVWRMMDTVVQVEMMQSMPSHQMGNEKAMEKAEKAHR